MSEKIYLNILKGGVLLSFFSLFLVFSDFLFPYISSKQLSFNILVEVLLLIWIFFLIKYPKYIPRKSFISGGLLAYFAVMGFSLLFSVDFNLSFWGGIERMLGFFHLFHFLIFYFIVISVFKTKKDYFYLLNVLIASALGVALYAIIKDASISTIGNTAYVAAMMLFSVFLQAFFLFQRKEWWLKLVYLVGIIISFIAFVKADISGSHLGLLAGILMIFFVLALSVKSSKLKIITWLSFFLLIIIVSSLFVFRSHSFFNDNYLGKSLRDFSEDNITLNTRLISYRAAGSYLLDHPSSLIVGVGHGNYAFIFDKYFDPSFYDYDCKETYFDRAHNNVIDILTTTGLLGLLTYLSIFIFCFVFLIKAYNKERVNKLELALLFGLLTAYFVQNLAVFDSFATYLYFMTLLAFINFLSSNKGEGNLVLSKGFKNISRNIFIPIFIILILFSLNNNIKSIIMVRETIDAYRHSIQHGIIESSEKYKKALNYRTGLERDVRASFIGSFLSSSDQLLNSDNFEEAEQSVLLAVEMAEKNEIYNAENTLIIFNLARVYELASRFYFLNGYQEEGSYYGNMALDAMNRSIESSPGRVLLHLNKANLLLNFDEKEEALELIEEVKSLNSNMPDAYCQSSHLYFIQEDFNNFMENFRICGEKGGFDLMNWGEFLKAVESHYYEKEDFVSLIEFYEISLSFQEEKDVDTLSNLAILYRETGNPEKAEKTALEILDIDPSLKKTVDPFLESLRE
jgi:O-antigen ligase